MARGLCAALKPNEMVFMEFPTRICTRANSKMATHIRSLVVVGKVFPTDSVIADSLMLYTNSLTLDPDTTAESNIPKTHAISA